MTDNFLSGVTDDRAWSPERPLLAFAHLSQPRSVTAWERISQTNSLPQLLRRREQVAGAEQHRPGSALHPEQGGGRGKCPGGGGSSAERPGVSLGGKPTGPCRQGAVGEKVLRSPREPLPERTPGAGRMQTLSGNLRSFPSLFFFF